MIVDYDKKFDSLYLGYETDNPTVGTNISPYIVKFTEIDTGKFVGYEIYEASKHLEELNEK